MQELPIVVRLPLTGNSSALYVSVLCLYDLPNDSQSADSLVRRNLGINICRMHQRLNKPLYGDSSLALESYEGLVLNVCNVLGELLELLCVSCHHVVIRSHCVHNYSQFRRH